MTTRLSHSIARSFLSPFGWRTLVAATFAVVASAAALPSVAHGQIGFEWRSIFPVNGNHYGWGYQDAPEGHSNWFSNIPDEIRDQYPDNFPDGGNIANIDDALSADEFIDLYTQNSSEQGDSPRAVDFELSRLVLDAGTLGRSYTIEQYQGGGFLGFYRGGTIQVGNDAGNDVIACPIGLTDSLHIMGNRLLISGPISIDNPNSQLIVDSDLTLSGDNTVEYLDPAAYELQNHRSSQRITFRRQRHKHRHAGRLR